MANGNFWQGFSQTVGPAARTGAVLYQRSQDEKRRKKQVEEEERRRIEREKFLAKARGVKDVQLLRQIDEGATSDAVGQSRRLEETTGEGKA
jgi:hypothetical protein